MPRSAATGAQTAVSICIGLLLFAASLWMLLRGAEYVTLFLFSAGAALGAVAGFGVVTLVLAETGLTEAVNCILLVMVPLGCACLGGFLALCILDLAFICLGLACGAALAYVLYVTFLRFIPTIPVIGNVSLVFLIALFVCCIGGVP